jgi:hypothetical protein
MRKLSIALGLISISSILSLAAAEFILRQFYKFPQPQFLAIDSIVGHRHRPCVEGYYAREGLGFVQINRHGFRDKKYDVERNDKRRIAVLGDSYTEAFQVEIGQTFHGMLEAEYEDRLEVLNFGVSGYGTGQEFLTYKYFVRRFRPDIVILAFYPGNDFRDNDKKLAGGYPRPYFSFGENGLKLDDSFRKSSKHVRQKYVYDIYYFLTDHSIIFSLLDQLRHRKDVGEAEQHRGVPMGQLKTGPDMIYAPTLKEHVEAWLLTEQLILELAREVRKDGAEFILFIQDSMPGQLKTANNRYYVEERLGRLCRDNAIPCSLMAPTAIDTHVSTGKALHGFDGSNSGHWNENGHRVAYTVLRDTLIENGLIP